MDDAKKTSAYTDLMRLVNGYQISQAIHVAASLGVADHLHDTACSIEELASRTAHILERSIGCCVHWLPWSFFTRAKTRRFR